MKLVHTQRQPSLLLSILTGMEVGVGIEAVGPQLGVACGHSQLWPLFACHSGELAITLAVGI